MRKGTRLLAGLALAAALLVPAAAQMRGGGARWTPPFEPASPAMLGGLQNLLGTPAGLKLASELPALQTLGSYAAGSQTDLRVVGALAAHLPADFEARLGRSQTDPEAQASLTQALGGAYQAAVPEVAQAVQARARQVALSVAYGRMEGRELVAAAKELERFNLFGPSVQDQSGIVRRLASQQIMEDAQRLASDFLSRLRSAEDAEPGPGTRDSGARKKVPESWKLRAYQKTSEAPKPAPPEPKAAPMARDLYARLGAAKGMSSAQLEAAYRNTAELYRPERYVDRDAKSILVLVMAFKRIEDAYAVLGDPEKRAQYDRGALPQEPPSANPLSDDYYERLGAAKDMTQDQIKASYRRAAAAYHPDKARTNDVPLVKAMTEAFQAIGEAYETLSDPQKRAAYDRKRAQEPRRK